MGTYLRRTYMLGEAPIFITGVNCDLDSDSCVLSVGPQEEKSLYVPFLVPTPGVAAHEVIGDTVRKVGPPDDRGTYTPKWQEF